MKKKILVSCAASLALLFASVTSVFAHVVVKPDQVGVAKSQIFSVEVPTEKDNPTIALRLVLPNGLQEVAPGVKPGWTIATKKDGDNVTEIDWTGGSVPAEQLDTFSFRAQVPAKATTLQWKAYQTYSDGSVVSWDQKPNGSADATGDKGPYSETKIVNDLATSPTNSNNQTTTWVAYAALLVAAVALALSLRRSK